MTPTLEDILRHPALWRADALKESALPGIPTGTPALDQALPEQGWPVGALSEVLCDSEGAGETLLLMPAIVTLQQRGKSVMLVAPPHPVFLPAWRARGVDPARLYIIDASAGDALWAGEQAAATSGCGIVLLWERQQRLDDRSLRRLHLAAAKGGSSCILYRSTRAMAQPSPAPLRLLVSPNSGRLEVRIFKRRGPACLQTIPIDLFPDHWRARGAAPRTDNGLRQPKLPMASLVAPSRQHA